MRRLFLLCAMLAVATAAFALPEKIYITGDFTNYQDEVSNPWCLEPTGIPGNYSGTFDIPRKGWTYYHPTFKLYVLTPDGKTKSYGDSESKLIYLFSDHNLQKTLLPSRKNGIQYVTIYNWQGGKATFQCTYDESTDEMYLTVITPGQPKAAPVIEKIWVLGDFNEWRLPSDNSDNGAVVLNQLTQYTHYIDTSVSPIYGANNVMIPSGKARFVYYYRDPDTGNDRFIKPGDIDRVVGIYKSSEQKRYGILNQSWWPFVYETWMTDNLEEAKAAATHIVNYTGPSLDIYFSPGSNYNSTLIEMEPDNACIKWKEAPINDIDIKNLNLYIENIDTGEKRIVSKDNSLYFGYIDFDDVEIGGNVNIWLTDTKELPVKNKWGVLKDPGTLGFKQRKDVNLLIKDGKPLNYNLGMAYGRLDLRVYEDTHSMLSNLIGFDYSEIDKIYVVGYMSGWKEPIEANASLFPYLPRIGPGLYEGVVHCPGIPAGSNNGSFHFAYALNGSDSKEGCISYYSSIYESPDWSQIGFGNHKYICPIELEKNYDFNITDWELDGDMRMCVDLVNMKATFTNLSQNPDSVTEIISDDDSAPAVFYNLQGQRIDNADALRPGIYIIRQGRKARKITVR